MANTEAGQQRILLQLERRERNRLLDPRCTCQVTGVETREDILFVGRGYPIGVIRSATCELKHDKSGNLTLHRLFEANELWPYASEDPVVRYADGTPRSSSTVQIK